MAHVDSINIHGTARITARAAYNGRVEWLELTFFGDPHQQFRVSAFMPYDKAKALAAALNEACAEPKRAEGDVLGLGLKLGIPPRLMEDDGPTDMQQVLREQLNRPSLLRRAMNGGGERET